LSNQLLTALLSACGFVGLAVQGTKVNHPQTVTAGAGALLVAFWVLSFVTQVGATSLIAWKIWAKISWRTNRTSSFEWGVLRTIVESGAIYSSTTLVALALYPHNPNACDVVSSLLAQISVRAAGRRIPVYYTDATRCQAAIPFLIIVRVEAQRESSALRLESEMARGVSGNVPLNEIPVVVGTLLQHSHYGMLMLSPQLARRERDVRLDMYNVDTDRDSRAERVLDLKAMEQT
jgi:hypothetical protein